MSSAKFCSFRLGLNVLSMITCKQVMLVYYNFIMVFFIFFTSKLIILMNTVIWVFGSLCTLILSTDGNQDEYSEVPNGHGWFQVG